MVLHDQLPFLQFQIFIYQLPPNLFCTQCQSLSIVEMCMWGEGVLESLTLSLLHTPTHTHPHTHTYTYIYTHKQMHTHNHIHMHAHIHTGLQLKGQEPEQPNSISRIGNCLNCLKMSQKKYVFSRNIWPKVEMLKFQAAHETHFKSIFTLGGTNSTFVGQATLVLSPLQLWSGVGLDNCQNCRLG